MLDAKLPPHAAGFLFCLDHLHFNQLHTTNNTASLKMASKSLPINKGACCITMANCSKVSKYSTSYLKLCLREAVSTATLEGRDKVWWWKDRWQVNHSQEGDSNYPRIITTYNLHLPPIHQSLQYEQLFEGGLPCSTLFCAMTNSLLVM